MAKLKNGVAGSAPVQLRLKFSPQLPMRLKPPPPTSGGKH